MVLPQQFELAIRYENLDFDDGSVFTGTKGENKLSVWTFGVNYYFSKHNMKLQANYTLQDFTMPVGVPEPEADEILIQASYAF